MGMKEKGFIPIQELAGKYYERKYYIRVTDKKQYCWRLSRSAQKKMVGGYARISINKTRKMVAIEAAREKTQYTLHISKGGAIISKALKWVIEQELGGNIEGKYEMKWSEEGYFIFEIERRGNDNGRS